jgi:hypothetical protein
MSSCSGRRNDLGHLPTSFLPLLFARSALRSHRLTIASVVLLQPYGSHISSVMSTHRPNTSPFLPPETLALSIHSAWSEAFQTINHSQPGINGLLDVSKAWALAIRFLEPRNLEGLNWNDRGTLCSPCLSCPLPRPRDLPAAHRPDDSLLDLNRSHRHPTSLSPSSRGRHVKRAPQALLRYISASTHDLYSRYQLNQSHALILPS